MNRIFSNYSLLGKNGFIRKHEVAFAKRLLAWKYEKSGTVLPDNETLSAQAEKIVADAHMIAKKSGSTVLEIVKDNVTDIKKLMK